VGFLAVTVVFVGLATGGTAIRTALVAGLVPGDAERVRALARQRVAQHVGFAIGAGLGALVPAADRAQVYRLAIAVDVATFLVLAAVTATVAPVRPAGLFLAVDATVPAAARRVVRSRSTEWWSP
jgi:hypothetical protein